MRAVVQAVARDQVECHDRFARPFRNIDEESGRLARPEHHQFAKLAAHVHYRAADPAKGIAAGEIERGDLGAPVVEHVPAVGGQLSADVSGQVFDTAGDHRHGRQPEPDGGSGHDDPVDRYGPGVVHEKCLNAKHGFPS